MKHDDFNNLVESIREAGEIRRWRQTMNLIKNLWCKYMHSHTGWCESGVWHMRCLDCGRKYTEVNDES